MKTFGFAALEAGAELKPFEFDLGPLGDHQVDVKVEHCGICYSDVSMLHNHWGLTKYPFVPGHEIIGIVESTGAHVSRLKPGQRVGIGWSSGSCNTCEMCMTGNHHLCASNVPTVMGPYGGFSERVRAQAEWVFPLPENLDASMAGPLMCGGITVFSPMLEFGVKPTHRVGVIGIGGLGHLAIKFLHAWGCEVTAFSSHPEKETEARQFGAHHLVRSVDHDSLAKLANSFDYIISTVNTTLDCDWNTYLNALRPKGKLVMVGAVLEPMQVSMFTLLLGQKVVAASPTGSPATMSCMLDFASRHNILPKVESFPFAKVNEAIEILRQGKMHYRAVLSN